MKYQELVDVYSALENTTKRLEKTQIISNFLLKLDSTTLEQVGLLILGSIFPAWSDKEIGIGNKLVMQAVGEAVGVTPDKDLHALAYMLKNHRPHSFLSL